MLDWLVGGSIFTNADRIVGPHEDRRDLHEGRKTHRRTHVIGEDKEGSAVAAGQARQGDAVEDATHGVLANTEVDSTPVRTTWIFLGAAIFRQEGVGPLHGRVVRPGEVGRSAPQLGKLRTQSAQDRSRSLTGAHLARLKSGNVEVVGQLVGEHPLEQGSAVWVGVMPGGELLVPDLAQTLAALSESSADLLHHLKVDGKRLVFKAKLLLEGTDPLSANLRTVYLGQTGELRNRPTNDGGETDERRLVGNSLGVVDGLHEGFDILLVGRSAVGEIDVLDMPTVGLIAGLDVLREGDGGITFDGDPVVVVEHDEVAQLLGPRQRRSLRCNAFLHTAVTGNGVNVVVEEARTGSGVRVEQAAFTTSCHGHADGVGNTGAERAGGGLDELRQAIFGVAGGQGSPGTQGLQVGQLESQPC